MALTIIERNVQLDLYDHDLTPSKIKAIALDSKTRYVGAEIHNGGQIYNVGQNTAVTLTIIRPDKTGVQVTGSTFQYTVGDGESVYGAYAELTQTALAISGTLLAQFMLTSGDQILRTEIFNINNGVALDAEVSEWAGEYQGYNLDELVQNVNESSAKVDAMEQDVSDLKSGLTIIDNDLSSGRLNYYDATYLSDLADDFYKIDNTATWEQGSWTSSDEVDANTWIRTPSANKLSGGFLIHNKDTRYGFFVAKYNATTGAWAGYYGSSDAYNTNEYTYIPVQSNVVYRLRIRYVANANTPLSPSENMIDIYRGLGVVDAMKQDVTELKSGFNDLYNTAYVTDSVSGSIAHFVDGADNVPMKSVVIDTESASATVTKTGKNLLKPQTVGTSVHNGISFTYTSDGGIVCNGTSTGIAYSAAQNGFRLPVGQYIKNAPDSNGVGVIVQAKALPDWTTVQGGGASDRTVTISAEDALYDLAVRIRIPSGITLNNYVYYPMLRFASDADDSYEPYAGETYEVTLVDGVVQEEIKTLLGVNNIWSDAGDVEVEYRADTKLYIDKRLGV